MKISPRIALITILTGDIPRMKAFYQDVLGFTVKQDLADYVEFESEGVRFAICTRRIMKEATGAVSYDTSPTGQQFELAFPADTPAGVDTLYATLTKKGAAGIKPPADMPWGQRTAFFADPDGNIHEIFADFPAD